MALYNPVIVACCFHFEVIVYLVSQLLSWLAPRGAGAPLFPPCPLTSSSFALFLLFPFLICFTYFSSFIHLFFFYQSSPTPFPGRRS